MDGTGTGIQRITLVKRAPVEASLLTTHCQRLVSLLALGRFASESGHVAPEMQRFTSTTHAICHLPMQFT